MSGADLGDRLSDLWSAELCGWQIDYDSSAGASCPWTVVLTWTQEDGNPHGADWATFEWRFYGETVTEALRDAIAWCEALLPWARCGACDGEGWFTTRVIASPDHVTTHVQATCDECGASGMASTSVGGAA